MMARITQMSTALVVITPEAADSHATCLQNFGKLPLRPAIPTLLIVFCCPNLFGMITQKMKYALKALLVLGDEAAQDTPEPLTIETIAKRSDTPKRFLEQILLEIRNAGIVSSIRGRSGGYVLIKRPEDISISDMVRLIDGPIAPLPCLSRSAYRRCEDCTDEATCRIRKIFAEVFWSYLILIESLTLADMMRSGELAQQIDAAQ
jgi:Rrf2 family protein